MLKILPIMCCIFFSFFVSAASPHSSTPNVSSVHHADSRGSLISTDSGNSLLDKSSDKTNSLEKVERGASSFLLLLHSLPWLNLWF